MSTIFSCFGEWLAPGCEALVRLHQQAGGKSQRPPAKDTGVQPPDGNRHTVLSVWLCMVVDCQLINIVCIFVCIYDIYIYIYMVVGWWQAPSMLHSHRFPAPVRSGSPRRLVDQTKFLNPSRWPTENHRTVTADAVSVPDTVSERCFSLDGTIN